MLTDPLPTTLDVRKAASRGVSVEGVLKPLELQRFRSLLAADEGHIRVQFHCSRDEENRYLLHLVVDAQVEVTCQRCLESMTEQLACENTLAVVWTDEQARSLPRHLDPLIVEGHGCNLWDVVEEELILAMPAFSYHTTQTCKKTLEDFNVPLDEDVAEQKPNPFNVLAQLKAGEDTQE